MAVKDSVGENRFASHPPHHQADHVLATDLSPVRVEQITLGQRLGFVVDRRVTVPPTVRDVPVQMHARDQSSLCARIADATEHAG